VQSVQEIERQRHADERGKQQRDTVDRHACSITMPLMRLATSSKRSITFSR